MSFLVATLYYAELSFCDFDIMHEVCVGHVFAGAGRSIVHCRLIEIRLMVADLFHAVSLVLHILVTKVLQTVTGVAVTA